MRFGRGAVAVDATQTITALSDAVHTLKTALDLALAARDTYNSRAADTDLTNPYHRPIINDDLRATIIRCRDTAKHAHECADLAVISIGR